MKCKDKVQCRTGHQDPEALDGVGWSMPCPSCFTPNMEIWCPLQEEEYMWEVLYSGTQNWEIYGFTWEEALRAVNNKI